MKHGCNWCLSDDHTTATCTKLAAFAKLGIPVEARSDADDAMDQLRERFLRTRTYAAQLRHEMRLGGLTPTAATLALNPDVEDV